MLNFCTLLAQADHFDLARQGESAPNLFGLATRDLIWIGGLLAVLAVVIFALTWYLRRDPRKRGDGTRALYHSDHRAEGKVRSRRKRRRHPDNLPRNPTLAEAGGLPPVREQPSEPAV